MSGYKGHIWGSLILSGMIVYGFYAVSIYFNINFITNFEKMVTLVLVSIIFSLFPDIDTNSKGQKLFYFIFFILDAYLILKEQYKNAAILGLFSFLPILSKHRGWTHRKLTAIVVCSPFIIVPYFLQNISIEDGVPYFLAALTGYFSHLIVDGEFFKI